jgi:mRNA-degrading endonuclease RelE of RelBE toxin-antitoxin system
MTTTLESEKAEEKIQFLFSCHKTAEFNKAFLKLDKPVQKIINQIIQEVVEELSRTSKDNSECLSIKLKQGR